METSNTIKSWAEDDRPREKLLLRGARSLSDSELLATIIGSGSRKKTAVDVAKELLATVGNNLDKLGKLSVKQMTNKKILGLGTVRSINIVAALELGRRRREQIKQMDERKKIVSSRDSFEILLPLLEHKQVEEFWILLLDRSNRVVQKACISIGGITGTVADPKVIYKLALEHHACGIVLCHNHPSGNLIPSSADRTLTKTLKDAGNHLEITVFDHIIIAGNKYVSFADEGWL